MLHSLVATLSLSEKLETDTYSQGPYAGQYLLKDQYMMSLLTNERNDSLNDIGV